MGRITRCALCSPHTLYGGCVYARCAHALAAIGSPRRRSHATSPAAPLRWSFPGALTLSALTHDDHSTEKNKTTRSIQNAWDSSLREARAADVFSLLRNILPRDLPFIRTRAAPFTGRTVAAGVSRARRTTTPSSRRRQAAGDRLFFFCALAVTPARSHSSTSRFLSARHPHTQHRNGGREKEQRGGLLQVLGGPLLDVCGPRSGVSGKATTPLYEHTH